MAPSLPQQIEQWILESPNVWVNDTRRNDDWFWTLLDDQPTQFVSGEERKRLLARWIARAPRVSLTVIKSSELSN